MEQCLTNGANKERLIIMFICALHWAVYEQFGKASDEADVLLVQTSFRLLTHMQQLWSPNTRIFVSFCYKAHSHEIAMMSISYLDEPTPAIFRDAQKTPVRICATTFFSHMLMGQCDTTARMYDISKNVPLKRIYLPMTRSCRTRGTSTTTAGGQ